MSGSESTPLLAANGAKAAVESALGNVKDFTRRPDVRRIALISVLLFIGLSPFSFYPTAAPKEVSPLPPPGKFQWKQCGPDGLVCSKFVVPLDYLNETDNRYIPLAVIKLPATVKPSLGPLFMNPGGPGGSGIGLVRSAGKVFQNFVGGRYDIVSWDPRGIGQSEPMKCFPNAYEQGKFNAFGGSSGSPPSKGADPLTNYAAYVQLLAKQCVKYTGDLLKYMSTASVARDLDALREAFGQDVTNYWGLSYGTFLGAVYSNMFPDRVGRFIVDGVVDPTVFSGDVLDLASGSLVHLDEVIDGFGYECEKAGPLRCALAKNNGTPGHVTKLLRETTEKISNEPMVVVEESETGVLTGDDIRAILFALSYRPSSWPVIVPAFVDLLYDNNPKKLIQIFSSGSIGESCPVDLITAEAVNGVLCTDGKNRPEHSTATGYLKDLDNVSDVSWIAGYLFPIAFLPCTVWPVRAVERYAGPWNRKTKNKVLVIGNTLDPVTPLESAQHLVELMEGSGVLLTQIGYGHCSIAQTSQCTRDIIFDYLVNGLVPESGTKCDVDGSPFSEISAATRKEESIIPDYGFPIMHRLRTRQFV
ncbi:TAP-like protein-domain-containing protein [Cladochytrium replicatum]|nr:TAP-like protein-domain-containing protein [Cladochytrium replicatum]